MNRVAIAGALIAFAASVNATHDWPSATASTAARVSAGTRDACACRDALDASIAQIDSTQYLDVVESSAGIESRANRIAEWLAQTQPPVKSALNEAPRDPPRVTPPKPAPTPPPPRDVPPAAPPEIEPPNPPDSPPQPQPPQRPRPPRDSPPEPMPPATVPLPPANAPRESNSSFTS